MARIKLACVLLLLLVAATAAPASAADTLSDFVYIPGRDVTRNCDVANYDGPCSGGAGLRVGDTFPVAPLAVQAVCEGAPSSCSAFTTDVNGGNGGGYLKYFPANSTLDSYVSNTTCTSGPIAVVPGSCVDPAAVWLECPQTDGFYVVLATYQLPPLLLAESCKAMKGCEGFIASTDGQWGSLIQRHPGGMTSYVRVDNYL